MVSAVVLAMTSERVKTCTKVQYWITFFAWRSQVKSMTFRPGKIDKQMPTFVPNRSAVFVDCFTFNLFEFKPDLT